MKGNSIKAHSAFPPSGVKPLAIRLIPPGTLPPTKGGRGIWQKKLPTLIKQPSLLTFS